MQVVTGLIHTVETIEPKPMNMAQPARFAVACRTTNGAPVCFDLTSSGALSLASRINRTLFPPPTQWNALSTLPLGETVVSQPVEDVSVTPMDSPIPSILLRATLGIDPQLSVDAERLQGATSVAIRMDQQVAMRLFSQIREKFQTMGWPLPT